MRVSAPSSVRCTAPAAGDGEYKRFCNPGESARYEVRADLSQVRVRYPTSFTSVLDGNLRLAGGVDEAQLQGELVVRQMVLNQNVNFISQDY